MIILIIAISIIIAMMLVLVSANAISISVLNALLLLLLLCVDSLPLPVLLPFAIWDYLIALASRVIPIMPVIIHIIAAFDHEIYVILADFCIVWPVLIWIGACVGVRMGFGERVSLGFY